MTDPAALTDEELAQIEFLLERDPFDNRVILFKTTVRRLIAALRAKDLTIALLEAKLASAERMRKASFDRAERLEKTLAFYAGSDDPLHGP